MSGFAIRRDEMGRSCRDQPDQGLKINEPWVVVTGVVIALVAAHWLFRSFQADGSGDFVTFATKNFFSSPQWALILAGLFSPFALLRVQNRAKSNYVDIAGYMAGLYCGGRFFLESLNAGAAGADFVPFMATVSLAAAFAVGIAGAFAGLAHYVDRKKAERDSAAGRNRAPGPDTVDSAGFTSDYFEFDPRIFLYGDDFLAGEHTAPAGEGFGAQPGREPGRSSANAGPRHRTGDNPGRQPVKALPYHRRPGAYTSDEARRMFDVAGIRDLPPSSTDGAVSLASAYILSVGWEMAQEFIHAAARDEDLPKQMRDFYIHALVVLEQLRREAELHNMTERYAAE